MAHELFPLLKLLESFGGDNFRHNGVVHQMGKYADALRKFMGAEATALKQETKEFVQATKDNMKEAVKETKVPEAPQNVILEKDKV